MAQKEQKLLPVIRNRITTENLKKALITSVFPIWAIEKAYYILSQTQFGDHFSGGALWFYEQFVQHFDNLTETFIWATILSLAPTLFVDSHKYQTKENKEKNERLLKIWQIAIIAFIGILVIDAETKDLIASLYGLLAAALLVHYKSKSDSQNKT